MENTTPTVSFHTLGCRLNFSETETLEKSFVERGYKIVNYGEPSDVTLINTCTVTDQADSRCRNTIRKAHEVSPEGKIVVTGCYAQMSPEAISKIEGVDLILGTSQKHKVFDYLDEEEKQIINIDRTDEFWGAATALPESRTRSFLKIQDGCNYVCSYCIIPFARGSSRTIEINEALSQAKKIVDEGFKEIVLTGVNIGEYESTSGTKLSDLVKKLLELPKLERLRLGSVEPNTFSNDLLEALASSPKSCPHFHIPLQSGDDEILKKMRRKYNLSQYKETISRIQSFFPLASFGADVIVGFPGETEENFQNTKNFLLNSPITHYHVFPYSRRQRTTAARLPNQIEKKVKAKRSQELISQGEIKLQNYCASLVGKTLSVLFETPDSGYADNFVFVKVLGGNNFKKEIHSVRITGFEGQNLLGHVL